MVALKGMDECICVISLYSSVLRSIVRGNVITIYMQSECVSKPDGVVDSFIKSSRTSLP